MLQLGTLFSAPHPPTPIHVSNTAPGLLRWSNPAFSGALHACDTSMVVSALLRSVHSLDTSDNLWVRGSFMRMQTMAARSIVPRCSPRLHAGMQEEVQRSLAVKQEQESAVRQLQSKLASASARLEGMESVLTSQMQESLAAAEATEEAANKAKFLEVR